jgi:hypothetical protein
VADVVYQAEDAADKSGRSVLDSIKGAAKSVSF